MARIVLLCTLAAIGIGLGALREFIFINLNYWIAYVAGTAENLYAHSFFNFLHGISQQALNSTKWVLAFVFVIMMLVFNIAFFKAWFNDHRARNLVFIIYTGLLSIGAIFYCVSTLFPAQNAFIVVAVKALHFLQYPMLPLILLPAFRAFNSSRLR